MAIVDMETRLLQLEQILARAVLSEFGRIDVHGNDELSAVELGVNMVLETLEQEIEKVKQANRELDEKVRERTRELRERLEHISGQEKLISRQREAIRELSVPVLELWRDIIAMPIIGIVDSQRGQEITERLLAALEAGQARYAILDITGVELVDTGTARQLSKVAEAARLLGTRCILSGIQPDVALTLATLDVDFTEIATARNLEHALRLCLQAMASDRMAESPGGP